MVESFIRDCEGRGLAYNTVRTRYAPIRAAWRRMRADYPDLVKAPTPIRLVTPERRQEIQCLGAGELVKLLDWLRGNKPDFYAMGCLMALSGMRMLEAAALRAHDINLEDRTVTVCRYRTPPTQE